MGRATYGVIGARLSEAKGDRVVDDGAGRGSASPTS